MANNAKMFPFDDVIMRMGGEFVQIPGGGGGVDIHSDWLCANKMHKSSVCLVYANKTR